MGNTLSLHDSGNSFQCCPHKTVAWGVDGEFVEATRHHAASQQLLAFSRQNIYATAYPVQRSVARAITQTQATALPNFHRMSQNLGHKIRKIIRAIFQTDRADAA